MFHTFLLGKLGLLRMCKGIIDGLFAENAKKS
jgi:hypothetical protein